MGDNRSLHVGRWGRLRELIDEVDLFLRVSAIVGGGIATFVGWWSWVVGRLPWPAIGGIVIAVFASTIAALFFGALYYRQRNPFYFKTKSKDKDDVTVLLSTLEGFWEIYHYAFSRDSQELSIALLTVPDQNVVNNQIKCSITDYVDGKKYFVDEGYCFPIQRSRLLYFVFDEITGNGEITAYYTHRPLVPQRDIYGILLGVSGGVVGGGGAQYPAAAKVILRYIGRSSDEVKDSCMLRQVKLRIIEAEKVKKPLKYDDLKTILVQEIGGYIDVDNDKKRTEPRVDENKFDILLTLADGVRNEIGKRQVPFVLRAMSYDPDRRSRAQPATG